MDTKDQNNIENIEDIAREEKLNELFSLIDENMYFLDEAPNFLTNFEIDEEVKRFRG